MKNVLLVLAGFVTGVVTVVKLIVKLAVAVDKRCDGSIARGAKDFIVCFVSSVLYGKPDCLYVKYGKRDVNYKNYYGKENSKWTSQNI